MLPHNRRTFLRNLTLGGVAVFTARHLKAIELDVTQPKDPNLVVGPYRKSWRTLYAELEDSYGYRLTVGGFANDFDGMTWREVIEANGDEDHIDYLEQLKALDLDGSWWEIDRLACDHEESLAAFAQAGGEAKDEDSPPTWREVLEELDPDLVAHMDSTRYPDKLGDLDDACFDWHEHVSPFQTPEGKAYLEITELLDSIENEDSDLGDAARDCFQIIEGSCPGNDVHLVYVHSREDLGILRRILHAVGEKVNIRVR